MDQWKGGNAVVTGAGSGIGAATTVELIRHGLNVVGLDVQSAKLEVVTSDSSVISKHIFFSLFLYIFL